ncbi:MAG: hypothetical protein J3K34DRAFT_74471 [Monoraphidium minutum]|nr:MAG: hypothetical protein J3K34DRAFT_74471 [Monoraphidium minutum]
MDCPAAVDHATLARLYRASRFCLVIPGDTQSSRRATEVALHGCVPVFVGPPYGAAPLSGRLDYRAFALVIEIADTAAWTATPANAAEAMMWLPPFPPTSRVGNLGGLFAALDAVPPARVAALQSGLEAARGAFLYRARLDPARPSATDHIVGQILEWARAAGAAGDGGG